MKQVSLKGLLEFTAGCGFLFAMGPGDSFALYGFAFAVLAVWSLRAKQWAVRLALFSWMSGFSSICFGAACLERAFLYGETAALWLNLWLWGGFAMIVAAPLALINGCLFAIEAWISPHAKRSTS